mmetsp:Transcript_9207/g.28025  ORF Transcript_9207/g.28025 Transcript_9207/m.28025 type:complete len:323 (-) Transcript_9207:1481-2449(-)|eukprot:360269-Chlamydomonas_euryale.AAC.3
MLAAPKRRRIQRLPPWAPCATSTFRWNPTQHPLGSMHGHCTAGVGAASLWYIRQPHPAPSTSAGPPSARPGGPAVGPPVRTLHLVAIARLVARDGAAATAHTHSKRRADGVRDRGRRSMHARVGPRLQLAVRRRAQREQAGSRARPRRLAAACALRLLLHEPTFPPPPRRSAARSASRAGGLGLGDGLPARLRLFIRHALGVAIKVLAGLGRGGGRRGPSHSRCVRRRALKQPRPQPGAPGGRQRRAVDRAPPGLQRLRDVRWARVVVLADALDLPIALALRRAPSCSGDDGGAAATRRVVGLVASAPRARVAEWQAQQQQH